MGGEREQSGAVQGSCRGEDRRAQQRVTKDRLHNGTEEVSRVERAGGGERKGEGVYLAGLVRL